MRAVRRFGKDSAGQTLIEFALVLPVFLLVLTGLMDVARAVWQVNTLAYAAREGTRYAIVHGSGHENPGLVARPGNTDEVEEVVERAALGVADVTVVVDWPDTISGGRCYDRGCRVSVDATAPFVPLPSQYLLGGTFQITIRGGSLLVIQR